MKNDFSVVTIGGGTGTYPILRALKSITDNVTAIVTASDSGGSTGRIRDEFGFVPVGDLRQSLAALAGEDQQAWISKLLLYRFDRGHGLKGHNLGNLILTALQDMTSSTTEALAIAAQIFRLKGRVVPVTEDSVQLKIVYKDGSELIGEHFLDEDVASNKKVIDYVELTPQAKINPVIKDVLNTTDAVIIGPGDYFASLMAVLVVPGLKELFATYRGQVIYFSNLMTNRSQTQNMTLKDHVEGIEKIISRKIDRVIANSQAIPKEIVETYSTYGDGPVRNDLLADSRLVTADLLNPEANLPIAGDVLQRSVLRHDANKVLKVLKNIWS